MFSRKYSARKTARPWQVIAIVLLLCTVALLTPGVAAGRPQDGRAIYGYVWHDWDEDLHWDAGEPTLAHALVTLANQKGLLLASTITDHAGYYRFDGLSAGRYFVAETDPQGFSSTTPNLVSISLIGQDARQDFGDLLVLPGCFRLVNGTVWHDANADNTPDPDEPRLENVAVRALDLEQVLAAITVSDAQGRYTLGNLEPAAYYVVFEPLAETPSSRMPLHWGVDLRACQPAIIDVGLRQQPSTALAATKRAPGAMASQPTGDSSVSGAVWLLSQAPSGGELRGVADGVKLTLTNTQGQVVAEQFTDDQGRYRFDGLKWQHYYLIQEPIAGYTPVLSDYWGVAPTDSCEIIINLENRTSSGSPNPPLFLPLVSVMR